MKTNTLNTLQKLGIPFAIVLFALSSSLAHVALAAQDDDEPVVGTAKLSESDALLIANKAYTGKGKFTDIELEMEKGVLVYGVEYTEKDGNEVDVKINADTGAVVVIESDATEGTDDDAGDVEDDNTSIAKMQTLINLLNQLIALLKVRNA